MGSNNNASGTNNFFLNPELKQKHLQEAFANPSIYLYLF